MLPRAAIALATAPMRSTRTSGLGGGAAVEGHPHLPLGDRSGGDPGVDVDPAEVVGLRGQRLAAYGGVVEGPLGHRVPAGGAAVGGAGPDGDLDHAVAGGHGLPRGDELGGAEAGRRPRRGPAAGLVGAAVEPAGAGLLEQQRALRGADAAHGAGAPVAAPCSTRCAGCRRRRGARRRPGARARRHAVTVTGGGRPRAGRAPGGRGAGVVRERGPPDHANPQVTPPVPRVTAPGRIVVRPRRP